MIQQQRSRTGDRSESNHLPAACIRGPEIADVGQIQTIIAALDPAALAAYEQGIAWLREVWELAQLEQQVATWTVERTFLLGQLRTLEHRQPQAVSAALQHLDAERTRRGS